MSRKRKQKQRKPPKLTQAQIREALERGRKNAEALDDVLDLVFRPPDDSLIFRSSK